MTDPLAILAADIEALQARVEAGMRTGPELLAEELRGLAALNAASRVYTGRSGRGTLQRSLVGRVERGPEVVAVELVTGLPGSPAQDYARAQELGAVIRPVRAKFLAIPTSAATAGGITSPRQLQAPRWVRRRGGGWLVFQGGALMFVLHPGPVVLPAKHYMRDAFEDVLRVVPERLGLEAA
jgi:hypothetical protein